MKAWVKSTSEAISNALHSHMKVATFYGPKAESTSFLKPSNGMQKCTQTHWMLKPLKKSQPGKKR